MPRMLHKDGSIRWFLARGSAVWHEGRAVRVIGTDTDITERTISVTDTGIGLAGVDLQRMFALSYTTKATGTGVGLSVSRSIVEAHGGQLWAEQTADRGATFCFTVPVHPTFAVV